ncbi:hypothetical protein PACTADRAFT_77235 [Pachysolen tannophilus NRRL Y-2460]|uniref:Cdc23 domain-containing protein n=1 Tax=Pachysolen tannophilus NRRL Y-2460 TaxID=669874 RepID=A0A1E4TPS7_PACTA|nr:hypothetical protein PACTADRAFT_77235 [Pachysolen tannophilus NRRL Y-2460]
MDIQQYFELNTALRESSAKLLDLNLYQSSKWSSEALNGLYQLESIEEKALYCRELQKLRNQKYLASLNSEGGIDYDAILDEDKLTLAKNYFNCKEFDRCANVLKTCKSISAIFLKLYSIYLSNEKKSQEESENILDQQDIGSNNAIFTTILKELEIYKDFKDPFLLYLNGVILLKKKNPELAQECFYQSLIEYPFNWSCWTELIISLSTFDDALNFYHKFLKNSKFNSNRINKIILLFFKIVIHQEFFQQSFEIYNDLEFLLKIFPNFSFLKIQKALISYHALDYLKAEKIFDDILISDPLRLDDMDTYSNILYVMEKKSKLSFLAQFASSIDKFRPETCCIIANYYSLRFEHEKAIMYYKRALTLSKNCLSAWTLMGHEFVELKNSHAAIESYRRAVDTNNKDYRAWYGLGQAYEFLDMHLYSLYYYQKAASLKPLDKRMWQALGNCYEKLTKYRESIKTYKKALQIDQSMNNINNNNNNNNNNNETTGGRDPIILYKLGKLYEKLKEYKNCYYYMKLCLDEEMIEGMTDETSKARLWLANYEKNKKNWALAYKYATELNHGNSHDIEEARSITREARMRLAGTETDDST